MPAITLRVLFSEPIEVDRLFKLQRDLFPGQANIIEADQNGQAYTLDLDEHRSAFLLEMLDTIADGAKFEPFREWDARRLDQMTLQFGPAPVEADPPGEFIPGGMC